MPDIKPRIDEGGEPVCSGNGNCPRWGECMELGPYIPGHGPVHTCIPGLRQQRDEAMRAYCEVRGITLNPTKAAREIALMVYGLLVADRLYPKKEG
jgi:hypothetical protein